MSNQAIGVDLTIKPVDYATWSATMYLRSYTDMLYGIYSGVGTYLKGLNWSTVGVSGEARMYNASYVNDPELNDYRDQMLAAYPDEDECDSSHREMLPYLLEQCYVLQTASHYTYRFLWPWVKSYSGEGTTDYYGGIRTWTPYVWIDQELKAEMRHGA